MIDSAHEAQALRSGGAIVEFFSGSLGVALGVIAVNPRYPFIGMPDNLSGQRNLRPFGTVVVPGSEPLEGLLEPEKGISFPFTKMNG